ncbi:MAG: hypothetical protein LiPW41_248 [Parcubacteria group bacterium LiPW_41]|nr:MAG: hypothetical protein LiPW41_248 [Parcubacteria group bacterium LiPW_41]
MASFIIFISILVAAIIGVGLFFLWKNKIKKALVEQLSMKLFLIKLPRESKEGRELKKEISISEQLIAALASFKKPFAFEVAVPHVGEEIHFYISVPQVAGEAVARQIQALWKDADVIPVDDYNIFNPAGAVSAFSLSQRDYYVVPLRTYQEFESDTFLSVLGGLAQINEVGEGCAIQYIVRPADRSAKKNIQKAIEELRKGRKAKDVIYTKNNGDLSFKEIGEIAVKGSEAIDKKDEKSVDEHAVKMLEGKISKPLFLVNVRVVASAPSEPQARAITDGVAAGFAQFTSPERNEITVRYYKKPEALAHKFIFREHSKDEAMVMNSEELASIFHLPTAFTEVSRVSYLKSREAPPPSETPREGLVIGESRFHGMKREIRLTREDRRRHLYLIGQTGTGKSVFLNNASGQDILNGDGVCLIDPNGDLFEDVLNRVPESRAKDVIVFDPSDMDRPLSVNMLEYDARFPEQKTFIINELMMIFDTLYDLKATGGPMFEQYARNALLLLMDDPSAGYTILEIPRVLSDSNFREMLLSKCTNLIAKDFWEKEAEQAGGEASLQNMVPYITSKFSTFIANDYVRPIIAQSKSSLDFRKIMDEGKILLVNLSKGRIGELNASLLGMIIVGKLTMAAFSRADMADRDARRDFYLYIDEFQNFTTPSISTILSEARKYRLCLTVAHQFIAQLKDPIRDAIFENVGSMISFRIGPNDAEFLEKQFAPTFNKNDLINVDNLNAYAKIIINNKIYPPFSLFVPFPPKGIATRGAQIREYSRLMYGRPKADVDAEIYSRLRESR